MNYGAIPIQNAHLLIENYGIATPSTWQFEKGNQLFGGLEDHEFTASQKQEIEALSGVWFSSANEFLNWLNSL